MTTLPLPEIGHQSYYLISSANRVLLGNNITEFVCDRLVELALLEDNGEELLFRIEHHRHVTKGTALIHYYNDELCDMYSDMRVAVGYDGAVRDITDFDGVRSRWKLKRAEILRAYSSDVEPLVEGTSKLLGDKEKFVHSLFGGYGFWRIFFQPWYHREFEEMERNELLLKNYFGEVDLPLNVESDIAPREDDRGLVKNVVSKATLANRAFNRPAFLRMLKNLTKVYNIEARLNVDFEESYTFLKNGTIAQAELYLNTSVSNWYAVATGHRLIQVTARGLEVLKAAEDMAETLEMNEPNTE